MSLLMNVNHPLWWALAFPPSSLEFKRYAGMFCKGFEDLNNPLSKEILEKIAWAFETALTTLQGFPVKISLNATDTQTYDNIREKISSLGRSDLHKEACKAIEEYQKAFTQQKAMTSSSFVPPPLAFPLPLVASSASAVPNSQLLRSLLNQQPQPTDVSRDFPQQMAKKTNWSSWFKGFFTGLAVFSVGIVLYQLFHRQQGIKAP